MSKKRQNGRFFTIGNPFNNPPFLKWAKKARLPNKKILEPFAGSNNLIQLLSKLGLCKEFASFDIEPAHPSVICRDTLKDFPTGYEVCITNPPFLSRVSASAQGLEYPETIFDDVYEFALVKCLQNCGYVASLVPESFIISHYLSYAHRLQDFVSLTSKMFEDTSFPVGLALFTPFRRVQMVHLGEKKKREASIWSETKEIGSISYLKSIKPKPLKTGKSVRFNVPNGNVGLIAVDNSKEASICFCKVEDLKNYEVKESSRYKTKLYVEGEVKIDEWNHALNTLREKSCDVLLTPYRGIRKDGKYRRRLDWGIARAIIHQIN